MGIWIILAAIAAGAALTLIISFTIKWLKNYLLQKKQMANVKKVIVADLEKMAKECNNTISFDELDELAKQGYTHCTVDINKYGEAEGQVKIIKDVNDSLDYEVEKLLGSEGVLVVEV